MSRVTTPLLTVLATVVALGAPRTALADEKDPAPKMETAAGPEKVTQAPAEVWDIHDVTEDPDKTYLFAGLRYRGNVIPAALVRLFVDGGQTIYTSMIGGEFEIRKRGFSIIPALTFHEIGTGDLLFKQSGSSDIPGNYSLVNSGMKILYASVDLLWSTKLHRNVDLEYGLGAGIGALFGNLEVNWVKEGTGAGQLTGDNGKSYIPCQTIEAAGTGCNRADHQKSSSDKVGGYDEKGWANGGRKPNIFPWITPQLGLRFKPIKNVVGRLGIGWSLTGFWFGLSGSYGLEQRPKP